MRIAVVGLGPAGSMFAAEASKLGFTVEAFDSSGEYRKACGDALTYRAEYDSIVEESGAVETIVNSFDVRVEGEPAATLDLRGPVWKIIDKSRFVGYLREVAASEGAKIHLHSPKRLEELAGRYDLIVDARGPFTRPPSLGEHVLVYRVIARVDSWDPGTALLDFEPSNTGLYWVFPASDDGRLVNAGAGYYGRSIDYARRVALRRLQRELGPAEVVDERGSLIHIWGDVKLSSPGIARIGEAAGLINAAGGEGNRMALLSALMLAKALRAGDPLSAYSRLASNLAAEALISKMLLSMIASAHPRSAAEALKALPRWFWENFLKGKLSLTLVLKLAACCPYPLVALLARVKG